MSTGKAPPAEGQIPKEIDDKARALQDEAANIREAVRRLEEKK
jgi:hypothetical protein